MPNALTRPQFHAASRGKGRRILRRTCGTSRDRIDSMPVRNMPEVAPRRFRPARSGALGIDGRGVRGYNQLNRCCEGGGCAVSVGGR